MMLLMFAQRMSELHQVQESRIRLDIGGQQFTTSQLTLARDPDSMLAAMFRLVDVALVYLCVCGCRGGVFCVCRTS